MGSSNATISQDLIRQYFITLESQFRDALANRDFDRAKAEGVVTQLEALLAKGSTESWDDAYKAEQLLVSILPVSRLDAATGHRLAQAEKMLGPETAKAFQEKLKANPNQQRPVLATLVAELQWAYCTRTLRRTCLHQARVTASWLFIGAFALFVGVMGGALFMVRSVADLVVYLLLHAITSGTLGASYSTLTSIKSHTEDIPVERIQTLCSKGYLLSRILIGLCAALVLLFFFHSGVLESSLLPNLNSESIKNIDLNQTQFIHFFILNKNFALLTVYCFLAGFSEKLVPSLLSRVEEGMESKVKA